MSRKRRANSNRITKPAPVREEPTDLALAMSGGGGVPGWRIFLDSRSRERKEEVLKYAGGTTGSKL